MTAKFFIYYDLLDALKEEGCPICRVIDQRVSRYLEAFLYENVNSVAVRQKLRKSLGFCRLHAWQLINFKDGLGMSIVYEDLLQETKQRLLEVKNWRAETTLSIKPLSTRHGASKNSKKKAGKQQFILPGTDCPACKLQHDVKSLAISNFIDHFHESELHELYTNSSGLCIPHLISVLNNYNSHSIREEIITIETRKIQLLEEELREFQRKNDYRFASEGFGKERDSWIRAVEKMVGKK